MLFNFQKPVTVDDVKGTFW